VVLETRSIQLFGTKQNSAELQKRLEHVAYFSLSSDGWTSRKNEGYTATLVHYIEDVAEPTMKTVVLGLPLIRRDASATELHALQLPLLNNVGIGQNRLSAATCDGGKNYLKLYREGFKVPTLPCLAHALAAACREATSKTKPIDQLFTQVNTIFTWTFNSNKRKLHFKQECKENEIPFTEPPKISPTRWLLQYINDFFANMTSCF